MTGILIGSRLAAASDTEPNLAGGDQAHINHDQEQQGPGYLH
jgi:hypothetical protein